MAVDHPEHRFGAPAHGRVSSGYGWREHPITHQRKFHAGIDLAVPTGTPVFAVTDAMVQRVVKDGDPSFASMGRAIVLERDGWTFLYLHLEQPIVAPGMRVTQGQTIGLSGATGAVTGPHLHFAIRDPSGTSVDPTPLIGLEAT